MPCEIVLIGFGEAGSTFARAGQWGERACGFDIADERREPMCTQGVKACATAAEALAGAPLILSLVTADQTLTVATQCAPLLAPGALWCDGNSVAPETKRAAAAAITAAGGRYVDMAVLAAVLPAELGVPLLLSGPDATKAAAALAALGFSNMRCTGTEIGHASTIKMIRSIMVKGIEALTAEMMLGAQAADVVDEVLASLDASDKPQTWAQRAAYNLERMAAHGLRRAAEMEEAGKTLTVLGIEPVMTRGTIARQRQAVAKGSIL